MKTIVQAAVGTLVLIALSGPAAADEIRMPHTVEGHPGHAHRDATRVAAPREPGQSAFAAIAEIVSILRTDPRTDWSKVDIETLRRHLIDMDNVTLRASVHAAAVRGGTRFEVMSTEPAVAVSIRRMTAAHAATMSGYEGMEMRAEEIPGGAALTVTGGDAAMVRGIGFVGLLTAGMHHQAHHLALARGSDPHRR
jgi:hypothetical protein